MKTSNDRPIGEVLKEMIEAYRLEGKLNEIKALDAWESAVGSLIARHTRDLWLKKGKLYIKVDSPALKTELSYNVTVIIDRLNAEAGARVIDEIVFI